MIIKGGSRGAPSQLAWHLQRADTNEKIKILELMSPAPNLKEAFRDWQTLTEGTRGVKGLYHANIDPAKDYVMTPEQWQRAVDVLEKELKLEGQPRAVVMHEKHGRSHIHVVWARTDIDRMVLRSDSQNYLAHERASQRLELEFGHEQVPGKHAKRDREKQPEFPRAEANQAEWQQGERTGLKPAARKEQVTALKQACDNAQAFKTALEEQGYVLAKGDRRDFVIVDETGSIHSLGRQIQGTKAAELRAFMKDLDRDALPTAAEAVDLQRQRQKEIRQDQPRPEKPKEEAPPSVSPDDADKWLAYYALKLEHQAVGLDRAEFVLGVLLERDKTQELDAYIAGQRAEMDALKNRLREETSGIKGYILARQSLLNPTLGAELAAERRREIGQMQRRLDQEQKDYLALLEQNRQLHLDELKQQPVQQLVDAVEKIKSEAKEDLDRYIREAERYRAIGVAFERAEREQEERQQEEPQPKEQEPERDAPQPTQPQPSTAPPEAAPDALQTQTEAFTKAAADRQAEERRQLAAKQTAELEQLRQTITRDTQQRLARFDARQKQETEALRQRQKEARSGITGFVESVRNFLSPARAAEQEAERQREQDQLALSQKQERDDYTARLEQANKLELENVAELHTLRLQQQTAKGEEELERYVREQEVAQRLQTEIDERERQRAEEESRDQQPGDEHARDGPEKPPKFTK